MSESTCWRADSAGVATVMQSGDEPSLNIFFSSNFLRQPVSERTYWESAIAQTRFYFFCLYLACDWRDDKKKYLVRSKVPWHEKKDLNGLFI